MLRLQELARRDEIVEHVLLVGEPAAVVPRLAIFAAAADVGDREHPTLLEPRDPRRRKRRRHRDVEAAVRIEQRRRGARHILAFDDEHRDLGPVLRRIETLLDRIARRIERDLGRRPRRRLARADIVAIDRRRRGEAGEGVEGLGIVGVAAKAADIADPRQRHDAIGLAVERVATHFALHVGEIGQQQLAADDRRAVEHVLALWHHLVLGHLGRARVEVGRDDPQPRRILVGQPVEIAADIAREGPLVLQPLEDRARRELGRGEIDHGDLVAIVGALMRRDDEPFAVVGHDRTMAHLWPVGGGIDQRVGALRRAELMEIDLLVLVERLELGALGGCGEARIIEARSILRPRQARELDPVDLVADAAARDVEDLYGTPVGAAVLHRIEQLAAVLRRGPFGERRRAVLRPAVGIDQHPARPIDAVAHIEHRLVLQPGIARVEIATALLHRHAEPLVIEQLLQACREDVAARQRGEIGVGDGILVGDPLRDLGIGADVVLEPAIRIGDLDAELFVDLWHTAGLGILHGLGL